MLNLKIQRLKADDFFVSISGKGLVTQLKEEIVRFLKAAQVQDEESSPGVTNLRLIYKGKVLMDCKTIEFYKIQNDDTIQLVPYRRRKPEDLPTSSTENPRVEMDRKEGDVPELRDLRGTGEITYIQFSVSEGPPDRNSEFAQLCRNLFPEDLATRTPPLPTPRSTEHNLRPVDRPTPLTVSGSLRSFKHVLEETLRRISEPGEGARELVPQLNTLISSANILRANVIRDTLVDEEDIRDTPVTEHRAPPMPPLEEAPERSRHNGMESQPSQHQIPPASHSVLEILLLETIEPTSRREARSDDEKLEPPREAPPFEQPGLVRSQSESINFAPETFPSALRVLPSRFYGRVRAPLYHASGGNFTALSVSQSYSDATQHLEDPTPELAGESNDWAGYGNIFTHFMNRFN